jgi:hypothetical protein
MPQIIVRADHAEGESAVLYRERVHPRELESSHFATHLIERLGWALDDACEAEERDHTSTPDGGQGRG